MPASSPVPQDVTTINYTLSWPHLENPSNTTFVGATQIDICRCGPKKIDLGHVYTRYRCRRPEVRFAPASEDLWVLQRPLGQINLLRPATEDEVQRRKDIEGPVEPSVYAGKNLLLLSGPCPRGRYQSYATLQFLRSLHVSRRQHIESLSLLIQPYEEDCSDDQGGRAYVDLARYIIEELPAFKTLCLNIWGEETRIGSREFAMVLWKEGVRIVVSWDWWSGETEEYTDVESFLAGIDNGVVAKGPAWQDEGEAGGSESGVRLEETIDLEEASVSRSSSCGTSSHRGDRSGTIIWQEVSGPDDDEEDRKEENEEDAEEDETAAESHSQHGHNLSGGLEVPISAVESMDSGWSDAILTPVSPESEHGHEEGSW